jgi:hypothetical protein
MLHEMVADAPPVEPIGAGVVGGGLPRVQPREVVY